MLTFTFAASSLFYRNEFCGIIEVIEKTSTMRWLRLQILRGKLWILTRLVKIVAADILV